MYLEAPRAAELSEIPVISLGEARRSREGLARAAREIGTAASEAGFFYVADHGVRRRGRQASSVRKPRIFAAKGF